MVRAIEGVIGAPEPLSAQEEAQVQCATKKWRAVLVGILVLVLGCIGLLVYFEERPPKVTMTDASFQVQGVLCGEQFPIAGITGVSLCQRIPRILVRTNGYGAGGHCGVTSGSQTEATGSSLSGSMSRRIFSCARRRNTSSSNSAIRQGRERSTRS